MKAVGVIGPDFQPRLFDVDEPIPARDGVVVEVMGTSWRICCSRWQHNVFAARWIRPYPSIKLAMRLVRATTIPDESSSCADRNPSQILDAHTDRF